ncbi:MAG TPA: hypothetical protein PKD53_33840 [Chloroflexaceae bacterium]|nr:hypothetical protein [Chloroflexaceae bacterium]
MANRATPPAGLRLDLGDAPAAALHPDGALSLEAGDGRGADLSPGQVDRLAELLALGAGLQGRARRRRAAERYAEALGLVEQ